MDWTQAAVLGSIQGLTEFLPVSSSAHLVLVPSVLGWKDQGLAFDVALHLGTLAAMLGYFWNDWRRILSEAVRDPLGGRLALIALATLPAAAIGLLLKDWAEANLRTPWVPALMLVLFGVLLEAADRWGRRERTLEMLGWRDAAIIGAAQTLALVPGVSRSGVTITAALALGFIRADSARFSFLLGAPVLLGAGILKVRDLGPAALGAPFAVGVGVSMLVGAAAIHFFMKYLRTRTLTPFAAYRLVLGAAILAMWGSGRLG